MLFKKQKTIILEWFNIIVFALEYPKKKSRLVYNKNPSPPK